MFPEPSPTENTSSLGTPAAALTYSSPESANHIWACVVQPELESTRSKSLFIILWATYMVKKLSSQGKTSFRPCESLLSPEGGTRVGRMWEEPCTALRSYLQIPAPPCRTQLKLLSLSLGKASPIPELLYFLLREYWNTYLSCKQAHRTQM